MPTRTRIPMGAWPWGKTAPETRIREIKRMIERNRSQIPIIEDQAREARRRVEKNIEVLDEQLRIAREFLEEQKRTENKRLAYALAEKGIDRIAEVDQAKDQDSVREELIRLLEETPQTRDDNDDIDTFLTSMED